MRYLLISERKRKYGYLSASSPDNPPGKPPKSSFDWIFRDFPKPPPKEKDQVRIIETQVVHMLWDKLEDLGFTIYPEQFIVPKKEKIDIIAAKGGEVIGIEVKCKKELSDKDIKQIINYKVIMSKFGIPFVVFWIVKDASPFPITPTEQLEQKGCNFEFVDDKFEFDRDTIMEKFNSMIIGFVEQPTRLDLNVNLSHKVLAPVEDGCRISQWTGKRCIYTYHYKITQLSKLFLELAETSRYYEGLESLPFKIQTKRELKIEHALWKFLRGRGYRVLCQYPIETGSNKWKKIDIIGVKNSYDNIVPHQKIGIEVKQKLKRQGLSQANEYYSALYGRFHVYIGVPPEGLPKKSLKEKLTELEDYGLGLAIIDPDTSLVEFYNNPSSNLKEMRAKLRSYCILPAQTTFDELLWS